MRKFLIFMAVLFLFSTGNVVVYAADGSKAEEIASSKAEDAMDSIEENKSSVSNRYDELMDEIADGSYKPKGVSYYVERYYEFYESYKIMAIPAIIVCELLGILIFFVAKYNKKARRTAILTLNIGIPLFIVVSIFLLGFFNSIIF